MFSEPVISMMERIQQDMPDAMPSDQSVDRQTTRQGSVGSLAPATPLQQPFHVWWDRRPGHDAAPGTETFLQLEQLETSPDIIRYALIDSDLEDFVASRPFDEVIVELTLSSLANLSTLLSAQDADDMDIIERLTLIANTTTYPTEEKENTLLQEMLIMVMEQLHDIQILTVQLQGIGSGTAREAWTKEVIISDLALCLWQMINSDKNEEWYFNLREVRVITDEVDDVHRLGEICVPDGENGRVWTFRLSPNFRGLHIFVPPGSFKPDSEPVDMSEKPFVQTDVNKGLRWMRESPKTQIKTLSFSERDITDIEPVTSPWLLHRSDKSSVTRRLLELSHGVRFLHLGWLCANADTLADFIVANKETLRVVELEVSLATGTWDQVFKALRSSSLLWIRAPGEGLMYASASKHFATGYLKPDQDLRLLNAIRYKDRRELARLLAKVQATRSRAGRAPGSALHWTSVLEAYGEGREQPRDGSEDVRKWELYEHLSSAVVAWRGYV